MRGIINRPKYIVVEYYYTCDNPMPTAISIPGVAIWGANGPNSASGSLPASAPPSSYNASYLKTNRRGHEPISHPPEIRSRGGDPQSGTDTASVELAPAIPASTYNANYLKTGNTRVYPLGDGPMTPAKAIKIFNGASFEHTAPAPAAPAIVYDPVKVLETLKLLAGGNISDEQLDALASDDAAAIQEREGGLRVLSAERGTIASAVASREIRTRHRRARCH